MTEAGMMAAEDGTGQGLRIWTDLHFIEVLDPDTFAPVPAGMPGCLVVTPLFTNSITPLSSGDIVTWHDADDGAGPYSVFPTIKHTQGTTGFFKIRGININHAEFEDLMFAIETVSDFKAEAITLDGLENLRISVELRRGANPGDAVTDIKRRTKAVCEFTPLIAVLDTGVLAKEFEANVKAPRFTDARK